RHSGSSAVIGPRKRLLIRAALIATLLGVGFAATIRLRPSERLLIPKSTVISVWNQLQGNGLLRRYDILSNSEILELRLFPRQLSKTSVAIYDFTQGTSRPLSNLTHAVRRLGTIPHTPSPDRKWLLTWNPDTGMNNGMDAI